MSSDVIKKWMKCPHKSLKYRQGVKSFIEFAKNNGGGSHLFSCPCRRCMNGKGLVVLSEISLHLLKHGMHELYTSWRYHGESSVQATQLTHKDNTTTECAADNDDVTAGFNENITTDVDENVREGMDENVEAGVDENVTVGLDENVGTSRCGQKKRSATEKAREPLYPSCPNGNSVMYAAIMMNNIKTQCGISDNSVTTILELMKELLPEGNNMPCKYPDIKKIIKELGMDYMTYDACVNDCTLYWKDNSSLVKCPLLAGDTVFVQPSSFDVYEARILYVMFVDIRSESTSFTNSEFLLKTRMLWAIHDFTALGTLAGCVTHGYYACPTCGEETVSELLSYSKKICYMGHRRWLPSQHKYRFDKTNFSGGVEDGKAPWPLTGLQVQEMVKYMKSKQGKGKPPAKKRK
ncbi:uncharacterized protein LOC113359141 [Papaver somniferum]|uniref:uncharacterized protein LOC113359141 n=1 Tax=Papaver somniferum TaxID=3469 RepID=UPI000E6F52AD|nr:uncharacterized protein LOC113359141 [Papaver somniferum]